MSKLTDLVERGNTLLVASPTAETLDRLRQIFGGSPVHINWEELCLEIALVKGTPEINAKSTIYHAQFVKFEVHYDEEIGRTQLAGHVVCSALDLRLDELGLPVPDAYKVVFNDSVELAFTNKSFISSVSYSLCVKEEPFTFGPELVVQ